MLQIFCQPDFLKFLRLHFSTFFPVFFLILDNSKTCSHFWYQLLVDHHSISVFIHLLLNHDIFGIDLNFLMLPKCAFFFKIFKCVAYNIYLLEFYYYTLQVKQLKMKVNVNKTKIKVVRKYITDILLCIKINGIKFDQ